MVRYLAVFTALFFSLNVFSFTPDSIKPESSNVYIGTCYSPSFTTKNMESNACLAKIDSRYSYAVTWKNKTATVWYSTQSNSYFKNFWSKDNTYCAELLYPNLVNNRCEANIITCDDGYYDSDLPGACDRPTPSCPFGQFPTTAKPEPDLKCSLPDLPEPDPENPDNNCAPMVGIDFSTTVCLENPNDVCSTSGVCPPGCGYVDSGSGNGSQFLCFGDDPSQWEKPDFDFPEDTDYDPFVDGSCRRINGTSYCPQDERDHINPDGTYPEGCGYVDNAFYCITTNIFNSPITTNTPFDPNTELSTNESNSMTERLLSGIQGDLRNVGNNASKNMSELGRGMSSGLGKVKNAVEDLTAREQSIADRQAERDAKRDGKLDDIKSGLESLGGETETKNYTIPTSGSDPFSDVLGSETITSIEAKIESSKGDLQALMNETKGLFSTGSLTVSDSGYVANMVNLKGVDLDLGAHWLEKFSTEFGLQHILWFIVGITGFLIILGVKF